MALIKTINGITPEMGDNCYLTENSTIVGDVKWKRDNPLIHECCLQYAGCEKVMQCYEDSTEQKILILEHQVDYTLKWEAILPSI